MLGVAGVELVCVNNAIKSWITGRSLPMERDAFENGGGGMLRSRLLVLVVVPLVYMPTGESWLTLSENRVANLQRIEGEYRDPMAGQLWMTGWNDPQMMIY